MGYYTRYDITVENDEDGMILDELRNSNDEAESAFNEFGESDNSLKWYDHEKDLKDFSRKYPEKLFKLSGEGEENEDIWDKYFKNGKMQVCKAVITFPQFDEGSME